MGYALVKLFGLGCPAFGKLLACKKVLYIVTALFATERVVVSLLSPHFFAVLPSLSSLPAFLSVVHAIRVRSCKFLALHLKGQFSF